MRKISNSFYRPKARNQVISPNELMLEMHQAQHLETQAWTVLALAASLLLILSLVL